MRVFHLTTQSVCETDQLPLAMFVGIQQG
ncbi:MAG: hypothetical protein RL541_1503, partial [Pseudomonadota bacterium]